MSGLLSRYAESVFLMARYCERAESVARIIETQTSFQRGRESSWGWIVALYSDEKLFSETFSEANATNVIRFYMAQIDNPGSIQASIRAARENARALRPMMSTDMWYQLNDFYNRLFAFGPADYTEMRLSRTCDAIKRGCYAQIGVAESTLYHDETWPFYRLGLMIERVDQMSRLLDVRFAQQQTGLAQDIGEQDYTFWTVLLRAASAYHAYRRLLPQQLEAKNVAQFLVFDVSLPRSITHCLIEIRYMIEMLQNGFALTHAKDAADHVLHMITRVQNAKSDPDFLSNLHQFNDWIQISLIQLTEKLAKAFFGADYSDNLEQTQENNMLSVA